MNICKLHCDPVIITRRLRAAAVSCPHPNTSQSEPLREGKIWVKNGWVIRHTQLYKPSYNKGGSVCNCFYCSVHKTKSKKFNFVLTILFSFVIIIFAKDVVSVQDE